VKRLKVKYYDRKNLIKEDIRFLTSLFNSSKQGLLISILLIAFLIGLDFGARKIAYCLCSSNNNTLNLIADLIYNPHYSC